MPKDRGVYAIAITGITGKVGGIVARTLLAAGLPVRAVIRDADKGRPWADKGCEVAIASISDAAGLTSAFSDVDGVFLMTPPDFDPEPGFPLTQEVILALINGRRNRLEVKIRQRYGFSSDHIRKEVDDWVRWQQSIASAQRVPGFFLDQQNQIATKTARR